MLGKLYMRRHRPYVLVQRCRNNAISVPTLLLMIIIANLQGITFSPLPFSLHRQLDPFGTYIDGLLRIPSMLNCF